MKTAVLATGTVLAAAGLAGCSSGNHAGASASVSAGLSNGSPAVSVSAGVSGSPSMSMGTGSAGVNSAACKNLKDTISNIPSKLEQAATGSSPGQQVQQTMSNISTNLKNEVQNTSSQLQNAVQNYIDKLQQVVTSIENGKAPNLSQLSTTSIDNACSGSSAVTVSPPSSGGVLPSVSASASTG